VLPNRNPEAGETCLRQAGASASGWGVDSQGAAAYIPYRTEISALDTIFGGAPAMAKGSFGEHLRREREMRGVSLDEVAQATRIGTRFLEALENERWKDLPGGVFNRGFLRSIARYLGLDEEALVAEYAQATNDKPQVAEWAPSAREEGGLSPRRGGRVVAWLVVLLLLAAAGAAGWQFWMRYGNTLRTWRDPLPQVPSPKPPPAPSQAAENPSGALAPAGATPGESSSAAGAPSPTPAELELRVEVSRSTQVSIAADGKKLFEGRMTRGESRLFKATDHFDVTAQNSFALILELNGVSMPPVGQPDSPGSITLSRKDLAQNRGSGGEPH
jgi:cytoskeletal protein RodZ